MPNRTGRLDPYALIVLFAIIVGALLRLHQIGSQVLIDDEWHALHQVIHNPPREIFLSFGYADHCIPLTLLYWLEANAFGLSEAGMRWPMLVCGIATLVLFPLYAWRTLDARHAALFALLLAISPALVLYSRIARPYAITLLLAYVAHFAFERYVSYARHRRGFGALYGASAILGTWMHLIAGPLLIAPFLHQVGVVLTMQPAERNVRVRALLPLALLTAAGMAVLILPPLVTHAEALAGKSGAGELQWSTIMGAWHWWLGTGSTPLVAALMLVAAIGFPSLWRALPIVRTLLIGLALTLAIVLAMRPAWVQNSLTFGRYLLPVIPLVLLAIAAGTLRIAGWAERLLAAPARIAMPLLLMLPAFALAAQSPLRGFYFDPNSYTTDPWFYFEFREDRNPYPDAFNRLFPLSPLWSQLRQSPAGSVRVAALPFYYESYAWDAPRWEQLSGQRVIPAYMNGFCLDRKLGEPPPGDARFRFRNAVFVADAAEIAGKSIDLIAYQKPFTTRIDSGEVVQVGEATRGCDEALRRRFGTPRYEDDAIVVFDAKK